MGYMAHHAMVFTSWNREALEKVHVEARSYGAKCTPIIEGNINSEYSFLLAPDGSKEGWEDSDLGDKRRQRIAAFIETLNCGDGSNPISWVSVRFGGDEPDRAEIEMRNKGGREKPDYAKQWEADVDRRNPQR